jgi:hypothetical protein
MMDSQLAYNRLLVEANSKVHPASVRGLLVIGLKDLPMAMAADGSPDPGIRRNRPDRRRTRLLTLLLERLAAEHAVLCRQRGSTRDSLAAAVDCFVRSDSE